MHTFFHTFSRARFVPLALLALGLGVAAAPARALTEAQQDAAIASLQSTVASQQATINALVAKLQYVTASGHDLTVTGNLHVVSGSGSTFAAPNGLGNVIIGYNETRTSSGAQNIRTGSHNLIVGAYNNYSSYGGIDAGRGSTISGGYATVTGGVNNTAKGLYSSVAGGYGNTASGADSAVGGGLHYTAGATNAFEPGDTLQTSVNQAKQIISLFSLANGVGQIPS